MLVRTPNITTFGVRVSIGRRALDRFMQSMSPEDSAKAFCRERTSMPESRNSLIACGCDSNSPVSPLPAPVRTPLQGMLPSIG
jgi:hypothetical protein